jgi:hypothetical protein
VYNNAEGGASIDRIARTTISDLIKLKDYNTDIVALIGTTSIYRVEFPHENQAWISAQLAQGDQHFAKPIIDYYINHYSRYHGLYNYYKNLILIHDFCKINQIRLILIDVMSNIGTDEFDQLEDLEHLKNYLNLKYDFDMGEIASNTSGEIFAPCGHFTEIVHAKLAEEIVKII